MPRPPIKKTKALSEAYTYGKIRGEIRANRTLPLKDKLEALLWDKLKALDPLELMAISAGTIIIKNTLAASLEFKTALEQYSLKSAEAQFKEGDYIGSWLTSVVNAVIGAAGLGFLTVPKEELPQPIQNIAEIFNSDVMLWAISFLTSYITLKYGPEIVQSFGGAAALGKFFIL